MIWHYFKLNSYEGIVSNEIHLKELACSMEYLWIELDGQIPDQSQVMRKMTV